MDLIRYYESLTDELDSLKTRIRNLMDTPHWQTDGEWKESVLRQILKRHLPNNINVGRGFVFSPQGCSTQIDILIYDSTAPVIFKDGDLVFVTPDAVRGIIEVKSRATIEKVHDALSNLRHNAYLINQERNDQFCFVGLFTYEDDIRNYSRILSLAKEAAEGERLNVVTHICLNHSLFCRFWDNDPETNLASLKWSVYRLEKLAPAYFINNLISHVSKSSVFKNMDTWFPVDKEYRRLASIALTD